MSTDTLGVRRLRRRECQICAEDQPINRFPLNAHDGAVHPRDACLKCWRTHLKTCLESGQVEHMPCLVCSEDLAFEDVRKLAGRAELTKILDEMAKKAMLKHEEFVNCSAADCDWGCFVVDSNNEGGGNIITCQLCERRTCIVCKTPFHEGRTCKEWQDFQAEIEQAQSRSNETIANTTKACPNCKIKIEKWSGCDHMRCSQCNFEFCWICFAGYRGPRGIYAVGNTVHLEDCRYHSRRLPAYLAARNAPRAQPGRQDRVGEHVARDRAPILQIHREDERNLFRNIVEGYRFVDTPMSAQPHASTDEVNRGQAVQEAAVVEPEPPELRITDLPPPPPMTLEQGRLLPLYDRYRALRDLHGTVVSTGRQEEAFNQQYEQLLRHIRQEEDTSRSAPNTSLDHDAARPITAPLAPLLEAARRPKPLKDIEPEQHSETALSAIPALVPRSAAETALSQAERGTVIKQRPKKRLKRSIHQPGQNIETPPRKRLSLAMDRDTLRVDNQDSIEPVTPQRR